MSDSKSLSITEVYLQVERALSSEFKEAFWIEGEWSNKKVLRSGAIAVDMVERQRDATNAAATLGCFISKASQNVMKGRLRDAGIKLVEGTPVRLFGVVGIAKGWGKVSFKVRDIDPQWTVERNIVAKEQLIEELQASGVLGQNKQHKLSSTPLQIGVVTAVGSAAYNDFVEELRKSRFRFEVIVADAKVQGEGAAKDVAQRIYDIEAYCSQRKWKPEVICVIRGGGSKSDLAAFDDRAVAEAVAKSNYHIISGVGHEIDFSVCDAAAATVVKTPTAAAQFLISRIQKYQDQVQEQQTHIQRKISDAVNSTHAHLQRQDASIGRLVAAELRRTRTSLKEQRTTTQERVTRTLSDTQIDIGAAAAGTRQAVESALKYHRETLFHVVGFSKQLHPENTLAAGWALVRDNDGNLIRNVGAAIKAEEMQVTLSDGTINIGVRS